MISLKNRWARPKGVTRAVGANPRVGQPAFVRLRRAGGLSQFYELGVERHPGAQGACDAAAADRAGNAVACRQLALAVTTKICTASRERAGGIGDRAARARRVGADFRVICNSDAQQL
jgi:hypothetical protein